MQSTVLAKLKAQADNKKNVVIDYTATIEKYQEVRMNMDSFDRPVHDYFFDVYRHKFEKDIRKALIRIMDTHDEVLASAAINKLAIKLPAPNIKGIGGDMQKEKAKLSIAACIIHAMMDTKMINFKREVKRIGPGQFQTITTLFFGGTPEKDLAKGIHFKAGQFYQRSTEAGKLNADMKNFAKDLSSIPFQISDVVDKELLMFGYSLKKDWDKRKDKNGKALPEHHMTKVERYGSYADIVVALKEEEQFYLELKYSGSGRMFYKCQLEGMRPQGKTWETLVVDSAEPYYIKGDEVNALKHHIYCAIEDVRVPVSEAVEKFTDAHLELCLEMDIYDLDKDDLDNREEEFGKNLLLYKAGKALSDSLEGKPTKYLFGWDFTTSGLIVAGSSFRSPEMLKAGNMHTEKHVYDAHTNFNDMLDLGMTRKDAKKLHQPLLHGGTLKGLLDKANEIRKGNDLTMKELVERLENAYGKCVHNIVDLADWGVNAVSNHQTTLSWTLPDKFRASHKAYFKSVVNKVTTVSLDKDHKSGLTSHTIIKDLPYAAGNKGRPVEVFTLDESGKQIPAELKIRGLYANITHSLDAYVLRYIVRGFRALGKPIKLKHDDFGIHPSDYKLLLTLASEAFELLYVDNLYQTAVDEIAEYSKQSNITAPKLLVLDAPSVTEEAECFLMP
ncbi:RNA polymerase [Alteromonas phage vB_AmeP_PT11-V19]|nr:RNA polymerase [Alteromonas phage vB_AmeP_PT11-V19]